MYVVFPRSDYYGGSELPGLASFRVSHVSVSGTLSALQVLFCSFLGSLPAVPRRELCAIPWELVPISGSSLHVRCDGSGLHHVELGFDSLSLTVRTELAEREPTHLRFASALLPCSCPLWVSPLRKSLFWRYVTLNLPCIVQEFHARRHGAPHRAIR